ncbi:MAG: UbiA family prenyltransferase [Candidatus Sifarchaeia archaeon]
MFRNLTDNIPKNIGLYSVGVMLLFLFRVAFDLLQIMLSLLAFLVSYSSIYVLNDLHDIEDDKKDEKKTLRKPLARGTVERKDAIWVFISLLILGLLFSIILNLMFFCVICILILINMIYSVPVKKNTGRKRLKHSIFGLPLVLLMQFLKIFLPWTFSTEMIRFPVLFSLGFSLIYVIIFKGYKENHTIGESIKRAPISVGIAIITFVLSISLYPEPVAQASIILYILAGIIFFRNSHLTDQWVLLLSPIYIFLGIIFLFYVITNM